MIEESDATAAAQDQQGAYRMWHYRLGQGHMGDKGLRELSRSGLTSDLEDGATGEICEPC